MRLRKYNDLTVQPDISDDIDFEKSANGFEIKFSKALIENENFSDKDNLIIKLDFGNYLPLYRKKISKDELSETILIKSEMIPGYPENIELSTHLSVTLNVTVVDSVSKLNKLIGVKNYSNDESILRFEPDANLKTKWKLVYEQFDTKFTIKHRVWKGIDKNIIDFDIHSSKAYIIRAIVECYIVAYNHSPNLEDSNGLVKLNQLFRFLNHKKNDNLEYKKAIEYFENYSSRSEPYTSDTYDYLDVIVEHLSDTIPFNKYIDSIKIGYQKSD